jgi:3-dehydroquinate dehydratase
LSVKIAVKGQKVLHGKEQSIMSININIGRVGEVGQHLRALVALRKNLHSIPSPYITVHICNPSSRKSNRHSHVPFHACKKNIHAHKILILESQVIHC